MDNWTLRHLDADVSESEGLAAAHPARLAELVAGFDAAAWKHFVDPLDDRDRPGKFSDTLAWLRAKSDHFSYTRAISELWIEPGPRVAG